jgi:hypothetical protein
MTVFIIGPLIAALITDGVFWTSVVACALLLAFEALLVARLYQLTRRFPAQLAKAEREREQAGGVTPLPTQV